MSRRLSRPADLPNLNNTDSGEQRPCFITDSRQMLGIGAARFSTGGTEVSCVCVVKGKAAHLLWRVLWVSWVWTWKRMTTKDALNAGTNAHDQRHGGIQQEAPQKTERSL